MLSLVDGPVTYLIASNSWKYQEKYLNILNSYLPRIMYIFYPEWQIQWQSRLTLLQHSILLLFQVFVVHYPI